jgi:WD40 repeat protein
MCNSGEFVHSLEGHTVSVSAVAFSADGRYVATGSGEYTARIWLFDPEALVERAKRRIRPSLLETLETQ